MPEDDSEESKHVARIIILLVYIIYTSSSWKWMPEDDSEESKHVARIIICYIEVNTYIILLCWRKYIVDLQ